ncbi:hypothetical protein CBS147343_2226 [Aspergillus niger]|nr:hypothetical protein CBS133816_6191 [Aspergillus niger]KAI2911822.1 hypothetical protein CBS147371_7883 [Aspergillus niger]KAI2915391.1 hypothetical protein CBS147320_10003 [Aspergillus niger]KAI2985279.1 hypothetical protein CBS147344_6417 [Aspergillus niger]KAI3053445.1 hypothetical protein CBS147352_4169 [Aspergillus niger]
MSSDSNDLAPPFGYPVRRNGTCYDTENDCGSTWGPYRECCPKGATCAPGNCCHSAAACGNILKLDPHCGNTSAILYYENDYFCCSRGTDAFARVSNGFVGCTDDVSTLGSEFSLLSPVSTTSSSSSATASATVTSHAASTSTADSSASSSILSSATAQPTTASSNTESKTNTGAIAGGVVGGVAGLALIVFLIWFVISRRIQAARRQVDDDMPSSTYFGSRSKNHHPRELEGDAAAPPVAELVSAPPVYELGSRPPVYELGSRPPVFELAGGVGEGGRI